MCGKPKVHRPASPEEQERKAAEKATIAANKDLAARRIHRNRDVLGAPSALTSSTYKGVRPTSNTLNGQDKINDKLMTALTQTQLIQGSTALNTAISRLGKK